MNKLEVFVVGIALLFGNSLSAIDGRSTPDSSCPIDSLFVLFNDPDVPLRSEHVLALYFASEDLTTVQTWLNDPTSYGLTLDEADVLTVVKSVLEYPATAQATIESNSGDLSENVNGVGLTATSSRVLLMEYLDDRFEELVELPSSSKRLNSDRPEQNSGTSMQMDLFPNPATDKLTINVVLNDGSETAQLNFFDGLGREVIQRKIAQKVTITEFDLIGLPSGVYTIICTSDRGERHVEPVSIIR